MPFVDPDRIEQSDRVQAASFAPATIHLFVRQGDVVEAVRHARTINAQIRTAQSLDKMELCNYANELHVPFDLLQSTVELGHLPVVNFAAGGLGEETGAIT